MVGKAAVIHTGPTGRYRVLGGFGNGHVLSVFRHDYRLVLFLS